MPKSRNPESGWVVTCNQKVVDYDYPYFMSVAFAPEYRAKVLIEYINKNTKNLTIENMLEMHNQTFSIPAKKIISFSKTINYDAINLTEFEKMIVDKMHNWNFLMDKSSPEASIYSVTKEKIIEEVINLNYGSLSKETNEEKNVGAVGHVKRFLVPLINEHIGNPQSHLLNGNNNWEDMFVKAFRQAIEFLQKKFGKNINEWNWGNLHTTNHQHPLSSEFLAYENILNPKKVPVSGDGETPLAGSTDKNFKVVAASVNRYAHDPSNWENSRWIVPLGSSGNPGSKNYSDQLEFWSEGKTIPQLWNWEEIMKTCTEQKLIAG